MSLNSVILSGNLTRGAELRTTTSGSAILRMSVAVNERHKNQQTGQWEDRPNFIDCVMFGARAEKLAGYLSKGTKVAIVGKLRYSAWEKDGQRRSKVEVVIDDLEFMSYRKEGVQAAAQPNSAQAAAQAVAQAVTPQYDDLYAADIPF